MATIFGEEEFFFGKLARVYLLNTLWVENFDEIALSCTVQETEVINVFAFLAKIQNGCHFWGEEIFFENCRVHCLDTLWVENFDEIALSHKV